MTIGSKEVEKELLEPMGLIDSIFWWIVQWAFLSRFKVCQMRIWIGKECYTYGNKKCDDLVVDLYVRRPRMFRRFILGETIGLAEAYMDGDWTCPDLTKLTALTLEQHKAGIVVGIPLLKTLEVKLKTLWNFIFRSGYRFESSLKNVQEHYDIGNDLYERFLDPTTFSYTCALYRNPTDMHFPAQSQFGDKYPMQAYKHITLDQAQLNKIHLVIKKANIQKHHRVLELGCGFGGWSLECAKKVGCRIDCYNLSVEQLKLARAKAEKAGVGHLINYIHDDYRSCRHYYTKKSCVQDSEKSELEDRRKTGKEDNLWNKYDAIVSVGMLEHVGHNDLAVFFKTCEKMLKKEGTAVVHTITSCDFGYEVHRATHGFIQKYIFPGACIPAVSAIVEAATQNSFFELQHFENIGEHYAPTLRHWRENFYKNLQEIMQLKDDKGKQKYDVSFCRMWDFYLSNCEAEFQVGHFGLGQFVWKRPSTAYRNAEQRLKIMPDLDSLQLCDDEEKKTK